MAESLEKFIKSYVDGCKPSESEFEQGKQEMNKIFQLFQTSRKYSIDRQRLAGSAAKKTAISGSLDFDCVVFVNPRDKNGNIVEISQVLDNFEDILMMKSDLKADDFKKTPTRNPTTLMFKIKNMDFDISVAVNRISPYEGHQNAAQRQMRGTNRANIRDKKEKSVSFVEMNIQFAKEQSAFAHEVARLAKFWNKTIILESLTDDSYVSGRSSIMELIAFAAAAEEEKHTGTNKTHLRAFRRFLAMLRDVEKLKISHEEFWRQHRIPCGVIKKIPPYLFDPSNPSNNFFDGMKSEIRAIFSDCSELTLKRLELYENGVINDVFGMQPYWSDNKTYQWQPENWMIGHTTTRSAFVDLKYNKSACNEEHITRQKWLAKYLVPIVKRAVIQGSMGRNLKKVKENIEKSINKEIIGRGEINWISTTESHESRTATITIPLNDGQNNAFRISFD